MIKIKKNHTENLAIGFLLFWVFEMYNQFSAGDQDFMTILFSKTLGWLILGVAAVVFARMYFK